MSQPQVLIVDDQPDNLDVLVNYLADKGLDLRVALDAEQALQLAAQSTPALMLLDVMMPGMDGFELCHLLKQAEATKHVPVIFMSALSDTHSKVKGFNAGAIDFISKPLQREEVLARILAHLTIRRQQQELESKNSQLAGLNLALQQQIDRRRQAEEALQLADAKLSMLSRQEAKLWGIDAFIGQSRATAQLLDEVRDLQQAPRTNVLVLGESGTGKELISRAIHYGSERSNKPFVAVNCSAIPSELADAEFFGHVKGAYTGATADRQGYFVKADGGTLFLDEIGDMPLALQAKLLRVLEDGIVIPIGGKTSRKVDVRVVAATNVALREKVQNKQFRQDLFFRLAGYQIGLPPLRERPSDIGPLVGHFLQLLASQMGRDKPAITREALQTLGRYHYPGNVRELKNLLEYALIASRGNSIRVEHLHFLEPLSSVSRDEPAVCENTTPSASTEAACDALRSDEMHSNEMPRAGMPGDGAPPMMIDTEEDALLRYAIAQGRIDNTATQTLLGVDHGRASYLLKKLHREGRLVKQGERRWTYYTADE